MTRTFTTNLRCGGCVSKIKPGFDAEPGFRNWSVDLERPERTLTVNGDDVSPSRVKQLVAAAGFEATEVETPILEEQKTTYFPLAVLVAYLLGITFFIELADGRFDGMRADFGKSRLNTTVHIGYDNSIDLVVPGDGVIDLADVSPLVDIPLAGQARMDVEMNGNMSEPVLTAALAISDLWFAGFPIGDVSSDSVRFVPLVVG